MNTAFLWRNEFDPDVEAIARYADDQHDACDGMGIVRAGDEWELCCCTMAALLAAQPETPSLRLVQNATATVRWSSRDYADAARAAGGVLVVKKEAA